MTKTEKRNYITIILALVTMLLFSFFNAPLNISHADNLVYSDVIEDLQTDETFKAENFPTKQDDYSLQVVQIAESTDKELFVYVYQPCSPNKDLQATTIRISQGINDNASWHDYNLTLLNSQDTLYKYKVEGIELKDDVVRYYDIAAIHRVWNENYDEGLPIVNDNTIDEVAFEVGQLWTACTNSGVVTYSVVATETVTIVDKYVGFIRYDNGIWWTIGGSTDSHYIAFSTDYDIEHLIEADVYYTATPRAATWSILGHWNYDTTPKYNTPVEHYAYIKEQDVLTNNASWFFGNKYVRDRIQSVDEFIAQENLTDETKKGLENKQWILRFFESQYDSHGDWYYWTDVNEVTILRLKFETDGVTYNLGVVDNKQTGDSKPDNNPELPEWVKAIIALLILILVVVVAIPLLPAVVNLIIWLVKAIWIVIKYIVKGIWWVITLPLEIFKKE